jgi:hypothetical protein
MPGVIAESPVRRYDLRRRRARAVGYSVGVGCWLGAFFVYALLKSSPGEGTIKDLLIAAAQSAWVGGPVLGYVAYARLMKPDGLLLWFRHFWPSYEDRIRFHRVLAQACSCMAYPITVQGGSYRASTMSAVLRVWVLAPLALLLWTVGLLLALVVAFFASQSSGLMVVLMLAWTVLFGWGAWRLLVRLGFFRLQGTKSEQLAAAHFRAARAGRRRPGVGVEVVKCDDGEGWKKVVLAGLRQADLVVVDVTRVTEPVRWELTQALIHLGGSRIVLVAEDGSTTVDQLCAEICGPLTRATGRPVTREWVAQALIGYPGRQAGPAERRKQYVELAAQLRRALAVRMPQQRPRSQVAVRSDTPVRK